MQLGKETQVAKEDDCMRSVCANLKREVAQQLKKLVSEVLKIHDRKWFI